ncbi:MAG TPA: hypothetical protein PK536_00455 [Ignavibacteria bacterium]|nr:hypothetical protein [Ignavibacteria bacterium]HRJ98478.1 hypothetical protein [Ignavibacteria bacterium]
MNFKRTAVIVILFFAVLMKGEAYSQLDSDYVKIGPEELLKPGAGNYFNFSDKNKVNIEVIMLGGPSPGKYLVPQGTTIFDLMIMSGTTKTDFSDDIKILRLKSETPILQARSYKQYAFDELYEDDSDFLLKAFKNPLLQPGDLIIAPEVKSDQNVFYYIRETIYFIGTLISFYYLVDNLVRRSVSRD